MKSFVVLSSLLLAVAAAPNEFERRAACGADNCSRAVFGSRNGTPKVATATADCSSFVRVTASPCTVTSTTTSVTSMVVATSTITNTVTSTSTSTTTENPLESTTTTITTTLSETPTVSATVMETTTIESVITSTVTTIPGGGARKRAVDCPSYTTPTALPAYAQTGCGSAARFSSVCSCAGIVATTTTLPAETTTVTETSTFPMTETTTSILTVPATATTTATSAITQTIMETASTTMTSTFTTTFTDTMSTTTTTTTTTSVMPIYHGSACNDVNSNVQGAGGCSAGCYCDQRAQGAAGTGSCDSGTTCGTTCQSDFDCGDSQVCVTGRAVMRFCGGPVCLSIGSCTSNPGRKRSAFEAAIDPAGFLSTADVAKAIPGQILRGKPVAA